MVQQVGLVLASVAVSVLVLVLLLFSDTPLSGHLVLTVACVQYFILVILDNVHLRSVCPEGDEKFEADVDDHDCGEEACCGLERWIE